MKALSFVAACFIFCTLQASGDHRAVQENLGVTTSRLSVGNVGRELPTEMIQLRLV